MKKFLLVLLSAVFVLALTGCQQAPSTNPQGDEQSTTEEDTKTGTEILGTWTRTGTFVNGAAIDAGGATMVINAADYVSTTSSCTVRGRVLIMVEDSQITTTIDSHNCPGKVSGATYTYTIGQNAETGDDTLTMTTSAEGSTITETWIRATN